MVSQHSKDVYIFPPIRIVTCPRKKNNLQILRLYFMRPAHSALILCETCTSSYALNPLHIKTHHKIKGSAYKTPQPS